uniref:C-type lectin domain-containing protein n=1 Tax=Astyanax mexicanus TaxID=7994 RepID=A0A3B1KGR8_ASTMX
MDCISANAEFKLPKTGRKKRGFGSPGVSENTGCFFKKRNPPHTKNTMKLFLVALCLVLLFDLVALCVLGVLYFNKGVSYESLSDQFISTVENLSVQLRNATAAAEELKSQLDQVQVNYENALSHVVSLNETERQYEVLKVKYRTAHEVFSACKECQKYGQCGDGWKRFGVKCYYFSNDTLNWMNSSDHCVEKGGHLVIITSEAEQIFVNSSGETHWIGLNDLETEGKWMWVNKQPLTETGVTLWFTRKEGSDEPDNWKQEDPSGENCACLGNDYGDTHSWFDSSCRKLKKFICEK